MRGMKKWLPFKSLNGQGEVLSEQIRERKKIDKPELSEDESELLNAKMMSLRDGDMLIVTYYHDGQLVNARTTYRHHDEVNHRLYFDRLILSVDDVIDITFGDDREDSLLECCQSK